MLKTPIYICICTQVRTYVYMQNRRKADSKYASEFLNRNCIWNDDIYYLVHAVLTIDTIHANNIQNIAEFTSTQVILEYRYFLNILQSQNYQVE